MLAWPNLYPTTATIRYMTAFTLTLVVQETGVDCTHQFLSNQSCQSLGAECYIQ